QSDRDVADYSLEMQIKDLEAVADRLGSKRFELMGATSSSPLAIAYAARHPERVENLILWLPWASGREMSESSVAGRSFLASRHCAHLRSATGVSMHRRSTASLSGEQALRPSGK